jgi:type IV pilus assembly protein PilE
MNKGRGFTLIELMVTLVIIAIIAAIAIPAYRQSVIKGNRRAAQSVLMEIVNREQQYFTANRVYADVATLGYQLPPEVDANYDLPADGIDLGNPAPPPPGFTVTLTATGSQASDGDLSIDSLGTKTPEEKW